MRCAYGALRLRSTSWPQWGASRRAANWGRPAAHGRRAGKRRYLDHSPEAFIRPCMTQGTTSSSGR